MPAITAVPYALVLVATVSHAYWNFVLKRSGGGQLVVGLSKVAEVVLFAPVFLIVGWNDAVSHASLLAPLAVIGAALTLANYFALAAAYERADLSFIYPISRGAILLFLPALGYVAFGERLDARGVAGILAILAGIAAMPLTRLRWDGLRRLGSAMLYSRGTHFALLAGAAAAGYTIWDKHAVRTIAPFTYFYTYTAAVAAAYSIFLIKRYSAPAIRDRVKKNWWPIVQIGFFNTLTYMLVLVALRDGVSSYVVAIRQLSAAFGVLLGWRILGEPLGAPRRAGVALILAGTVLVAVGR